MKLNKKNAQAIAGLGRAFLVAKNYEQAKTYADMAMKVGKNVSAGYILRGDIASAEDDGGLAASYYEMSTQQDPQDPTAYVKYARVYQKVDADGAVAMLEKLRSVKPDYPVDAAAGYMYSSNNKLKTALQYYGKVQNINSLDDYILFDYASTAYVLEDYDKTLQLAAAGVQKYPHYYAEALMNTGKFDEAIAAYKHIPEVDPENKETNKLISGLYVKAHRFPEAVAAMEQYITEAGENATYKELDALADIYIDEASVEGATDAVKKAAFENADKVYARMAEKYDYAATYAVWKRALMNHQINPDVKVGRALPYYQQYISLVEPKAEKTASELNKLAISYTYLAVHYIQNDKKAEAKEWAQKLAEIRPDDPNAQQILSIK